MKASLFAILFALGACTSQAALIGIPALATGRTTGATGDAFSFASTESIGNTFNGIVEFDLSSIPSGATINSATINLTQRFNVNNGVFSDVEFRGYLGNGAFDIGDFGLGAGNTLAGPGVLVSPNGTPDGTVYNITLGASFLQNLVDNSDQYFGMELVQQGTRVGSSVGISFNGTFQTPPPVLSIDYSAGASTIPEPGTWALLGVMLMGGAYGVRRRRKA